MVRQAFKLHKMHGILGSPEQEKGPLLEDGIELLVRDFHCDDENSRLLPGKTIMLALGGINTCRRG